jgi:hypothetical protein
MAASKITGNYVGHAAPPVKRQPTMKRRTPIISGFPGSAVVPTASAGVPPMESSTRNRSAFRACSVEPVARHNSLVPRSGEGQSERLSPSSAQAVIPEKARNCHPFTSVLAQ